MTIIDNEMLWRQFGAAIDMLGDALRDCPAELWKKRLWEDRPGQWVAPGFSTFWYLGYHALFWLDLYLTGAEEGFAPPAPFDLVEMEPGEVLPRTYTREELLGYLEYCRRAPCSLAALLPICTSAPTVLYWLRRPLPEGSPWLEGPGEGGALPHDQPLHLGNWTVG
jgi:hypothetical protein